MGVPLPPSLITRCEMKWYEGCLVPRTVYWQPSLQPPICRVAVRTRSDAKANTMRSIMNCVTAMRLSSLMAAALVPTPLDPRRVERRHHHRGDADFHLAHAGQVKIEPLLVGRAEPGKRF